MQLNPCDYLSRFVLFTPAYFDRKERAFIRTILRAGDYVIDVGANIGIYTLLFSKLVGPSGRVLAIEAEPNNAAQLRHNVLLNESANVAIVETGVSDEEETLQLTLDTKGNAGAHSFIAKRSQDSQTRQIHCVPLLSLIASNRPVRFLKIDIEGFEYRVLSRFLRDAPKSVWPAYIMLEDSPAIREADAVAVLTKAGYEQVARYDFNVILRHNR